MAVSSLCLHLAVSDWSESFSTALITPEPEFQPLCFVCVKVAKFSVVRRKDRLFGYLSFD